MNTDPPALFHSLYTRHYRAVPRRLYWLAPLLLFGFVGVLVLLAFVRTDKVIDVRGRIVPPVQYTTRLPQRGFIVEHHIRPGRWFRRGQPMASVQQDDGTLRVFAAPHDGVVLESGLRQPADGALPEGFLLATLVDPNELVIRVELPPAVRGSIESGSPAYYRYDTFIAPTRSQVLHVEVGLAADQTVTSHVDVALAGTHRTLASLSKELPVRLVQHDIALVDYFLAE